MTNTSTPDFTGVVDQQFLLAPLNGGTVPGNYLNVFPEEVYNKSIDSHLVSLVYTLLGPAGIGWLQSNYLQARLALEEYGLGNFDLDRFYGNPLKFGRILEESYDQDPSGLVSREDWEKIRAKDAAYRSRALDYVTGIRAGGTPLGMKYVARSGIGHEVEIFERYRRLYDQISDDPLGLPDYGVTDSTEEMVVIPRRELPQNEVQLLQIDGSPTGGYIRLFFPVGDEVANETAEIAPNATSSTVQAFLEAIPAIGTGNVVVTGGPLPQSMTISFTGTLASIDVPKLQVLNFLTSSTEIIIAAIKTTQEGISSTDEIVRINPRDQKYLLSALGRIKPMTTLPSFEAGKSLRANQIFNSVHATSQLSEVVRYVTGRPGVNWPTSTNYWIREGIEQEAPKGFRHTALSYVGYHTPIETTSYSDSALEDVDYLSSDWTQRKTLYTSDHVGPFNEIQIARFPVLQGRAQTDVLSAELALAESPEPLMISSSTLGDLPIPLVNGIYPADYQSLQGISVPVASSQRFWASHERREGSDYLEIDLGSVKALNAITFETTRKPISFSVDYDVLDLTPRREWRSALIDPSLPSVTEFGYTPDAENPWEDAKISLVSPTGGPIFTRFLRLKFQRRTSSDSLFTDPLSGDLYPYSCEVRNLRIQRNVH